MLYSWSLLYWVLASTINKKQQVWQAYYTKIKITSEVDKVFKIFALKNVCLSADL